jgi:glycosyltransferase involved in cell wall biosynthesis
MRLLIASEFAEVVGGRETYLRAVIPLLRAAGYELGFAFERPPHTGMPSILDEDAGPNWNLTTDLGGITAWNPDVVFLHGLADARLERQIADRFDAVYFAHGYNGVCVTGTRCHTLPEYATCNRTLGLACLFQYYPRRCGGLNPATMVHLYQTQTRRRATFNRYRTVLVASRHMRDEYQRHGVASDRLRLLPLFAPNVVRDDDPPPPRSRTDRVLFVGRTIPLKGLQHLIAALPIACAKLGRRLTLVVAGDGSERAQAEADVRRLGIDLEFLGWVGPERRTAEMRRADVLAVPSLWPEPFGLVGVEAGSVGLPAVGYATGGIPDWLLPGETGESASGSRPSPTELATALVRALKDDVHLQRLRVGAWEMAGRFTADAHVQALSEVFRSGMLMEAL